MQLTKRSELDVFIIGAILLAPISVTLLGTQVFVLQTLLIAGLFYYVLTTNAKGLPALGTRMASLDLLFYLYLAWILFSFTLNFVFSFDPFGIQLRRVISLGIAILLMSGFFIGSVLGKDARKADAIIQGVFFTYMFVLTYVVLVFVLSGTNDLYMIRRTIGQRLPMVIAFITAIASAYFLAGRWKRYSGFVAATGLILVLLSLTRAAYIQLLISYGLIAVRYVKFSITRLVLGVLLVVILTVPTYYIFKDAKATRQIVQRFEQTLDIKQQSTEDPSGSFRLAMWRFLGNKLWNEKRHLILGYGQLGSSFITDNMVMPDGTRGAGESAHSQYLDIVVREGIIGLLIFLVLAYTMIRLGWSTRLSINGPSSTFVFANTIAVFGTMFYGIFHETVRYPMFGFYFWVYMGMLSAISKNTRGDAVEKVKPGS